jgi:cytochrome c oxidase subunit III
MIAKTAIDVSELPSTEMDHRSPIWWGNILLLFIETTMFGLVIAAYFYFRVVDFHQWPPPRSTHNPIQLVPDPALAIPTINLALILISCLPMWIVDRACLRRQTFVVKLALLVSVAFGLLAIGLRFVEFKALHFRWDENAYASVVWTILGIHLAHLITGTCENGLMTVWALARGIDNKHFRDIRITTFYWFWIAAVWVILYLIIYWFPRWS